MRIDPVLFLLIENFASWPDLILCCEYYFWCIIHTWPPWLYRIASFCLDSLLMIIFLLLCHQCLNWRINWYCLQSYTTCVILQMFTLWILKIELENFVKVLRQKTLLLTTKLLACIETKNTVLALLFISNDLEQTSMLIPCWLLFINLLICHQSNSYFVPNEMSNEKKSSRVDRFRIIFFYIIDNIPPKFSGWERIKSRK